MTDWKNISEEEGKKKYASMMLNLVSFVESGELDEFVEVDIEKLRTELKLAEKTGDNNRVDELIKKLAKDGVIVEIKSNEVAWKWNKWWGKK